MSRLSRQLAHLADELDQERARHDEVIRRLAEQDPFAIKPGERLLMPSAVAPLRCTTCNGSSILTERFMWSSDGLRDVGACPDCNDGVRPCEHCGEADAVGISADGDAACSECRT